MIVLMITNWNQQKYTCQAAIRIKCFEFLVYRARFFSENLFFFFSKTINYIGAGHFCGGQTGIKILQFILYGLTQASFTSKFTF